MRQNISLVGTWDMSYDGRNYDKKIMIPGSVPINETSYPDPESLTAYFRKRISLDQKEIPKRKRIVFYGSDLITHVWINGKEAGKHRGGFDKFSFDVTSEMNKPVNEIVVKAEDMRIEEIQNEIIGKQDWYGNITGMWQPVELEILEETFIESADFTLNKDSISIKLNIEGAFEVVDYRLAEYGEILKSGHGHQSDFIIQRDNLKCWSPNDPKRYDLTVEVLQNGNIVDRLEKKTGFRDIAQKNGEIYINDKPFYMKGLLDQDYFPETDYVAPSSDFLAHELHRIKELGYNTIRYHVKTPPSEYVELADEVGLLLWIDLPYAKTFDDDSKEYLAKLREDLMKRYAYSPSFCIMTLINESWGVDLSSESENKWLSDFWNESKVKIKDRLIVDNSACHGNHHVQSDINDFHFYFSHPENKHLWDQHISDFANNTFLPFKQTDVTGFSEQDPGKLPKIVSEFGVWSLSDPSLWQGKWMNYPMPGSKKIKFFTDETVKQYGQNASDLFKQVQWQGYFALKHQIEQMRLHDTIKGFVLTELSDISWEANGILDYSRNDKPFTGYLKLLNQELLPIMDERGNIFCSNITSEKIVGTMYIEFNAKPIATSQFISDPMKTKPIHKIELPKEKGLLIIKLTVEDQTVSTNTYQVHNIGQKKTEFKIFDTYSEEAEKLAERGERIYIQLKNPQKNKNFEIVPTVQKAIEGTDITWAGDWISGFFHYHPDMLRTLSYESGAEELIGTFTGMTIIHSDDYERLIGKMLGWNLTNASYVVRKKIGKGEIILSTLDLIKTGKLSILP